MMLACTSFVFADCPLPVAGQTPDPNCTATSVGLVNPLKVTSLADFVKTILGIVVKIGVPIVSIFIILAGLQFVLARGNGEKLEKAKQNLLWVLIGAAILLGCWVIAEIISGTINALM